jgi:hypothetical protein
MSWAAATARTQKVKSWEVSSIGGVLTEQLQVFSLFEVGLSIAKFFKSISPILHDYSGTTLGAGL